MKNWQTPMPKPPKNKHRKRCYQMFRWVGFSKSFRAGGKIVWLTDAQLTFAYIKYPNHEFDEVLERDALEEFKKYLDQTIE